MSHGPNVVPRTEVSVQPPELLTAQELVEQILHAGPGARLTARNHYLPDETTKIGRTTYRSDFTRGPAIYYHEDPEREDFITGILPLNGQTVAIGPPRPQLGDKRVYGAVLSGYATVISQVPIDPIAERDYRFELLPTEEDIAGGY